MTTRQSARPTALGWLAACAVVVLACDPPPTEIPPGEAASTTAAPSPVRPPPPTAPPRPMEATEPVEQPADAGAAPGAEPTAKPPAGETGSPQALAAVGGACDTAADCQSGICEGLGCGPKGGRCAAKGRACTKDRRAYCGCDGNTFHASGSCPGARFSMRSMCTGGGGSGDGGGGGGGKLAADGAACKAAGECQSGICEGEGCGAASSGVCVSRKRPCTADLRAFCGCDGATFNGSTSCPGRRYASRGACKK